MSASLVNFVKNKRKELAKLTSREEKKLRELGTKAKKNYEIVSALIGLGVINFARSVTDSSGKTKLNCSHYSYRYTSYHRGDTPEGTEEYDVLKSINNSLNFSIVANYIRAINDFRDYQENLIKDGKMIPMKNDRYECDVTGKTGLPSFIKVDRLQNYGEILSNMPITSLSEIKRIADLLGFAIIPIDYVSDLVYKTDENFSSDELIKGRDKFDKLFVDYGDTYILCPLRFIDLLKVSKSNKSLDNIYYGSKISIHGMTINLNIPVFRTIFSQLDDLNDRVTKLDENVNTQIKTVQDNISSLQKSLGQISDSVSHEIDNRMKGINGRVEKLEEWRIQCLQDPMIFKCREFSDDSDCLIGFSWGPEFSDGFVKEFNMSVNEIKDIKDKLK